MNSKRLVISFIAGFLFIFLLNLICIYVLDIGNYFGGYPGIISVIIMSVAIYYSWEHEVKKKRVEEIKILFSPGDQLF